MEFLQVSGMTRVFLDQRPMEDTDRRLVCLANEQVAFGVAYCNHDNFEHRVTYTVESPIAAAVRVRHVGHVPATFLRYDFMEGDEDMERTSPGLYPDYLEDLDGSFFVVRHLWESLFISVDATGMPAGEHPVTVHFTWDGGSFDASVTVKILPVALPEQKLLYTQWFHADCVAEYYNEKVFSPSHWKHMESFLAAGTDGGMNMVLTPIFTPPLDTAVGGERLTVQLVDVEKTEDGYKFGFAKLGRWIRMCRKVGYKKFEISHFFTQWGAEHAPKIMAKVNGKLERIFGWETDAAGEEYRAFLAAFLPELLAYLKSQKADEDCYFHISDEPTAKMLEGYMKAKEGAAKYLEGYPIMDALSHYELYEAGAVTLPVISTGAVQNFLDKGYTEPWVYYCCGQGKGLSNRHFCMPLSRVRVLSVPLFKFSCKGFLQWGMNFYHSQYSRGFVNPFVCADADGRFPAGDSFIYYPGKEGAMESLRAFALKCGLYDLRAMELLASRIGHDGVVALMEEGLDAPLAFNQAPTGAEWLLGMRARINERIEELFC